MNRAGEAAHGQRGGIGRRVGDDVLACCLSPVHATEARFAAQRRREGGAPFMPRYFDAAARMRADGGRG